MRWQGGTWKSINELQQCLVHDNAGTILANEPASHARLQPECVMVTHLFFAAGVAVPTISILYHIISYYINQGSTIVSQDKNALAVYFRHGTSMLPLLLLLVLLLHRL